MTTYESEIKTIIRPQEQIFNTLSNFENIKKIQESSEENREKISSYFEDFESDVDSVHFNVTGIGKVGFRIIEREHFKTIKLEAENSPIQANGWIQLVKIDDNQTKMKLTVKADLPMMIKMMVDKKIKSGINTIADALTTILESNVIITTPNEENLGKDNASR